MSDACRSCSAPVRWIRMTGTGKANPLDPAPADNGNVRILEDGRGEALSQRDAVAAQAAGVELYLSHFATCPQRERWRNDDAGSRGHECPWPGCTERVPRYHWGCKPHWYRVPRELRESCTWAWRYGTAADHMAVLEEIDEWIAGQPIQGALL